jgi:hypothetical protein
MSIEDTLQSLRVLIEAQVKIPALLLVSAATNSDCSDAVAQYLADAFGGTGKSTLLVDTSRSRGEKRTEEGAATFDLVKAVPTRDFHAKLDVLRAGREITILHAAPLLAQPYGLELARLADGVLIAVRLGRAIRREDEHTRRTLEQLGARVLGIIQTSASIAKRRPEKIAAVAEVEPATALRRLG